MEYKKLESLVPPLELCKRIPKGAFADSAFIYTKTGLQMREIQCLVNGEWITLTFAGIPAPTLEEILEKFPSGTTFIATVFRNSWVISHFDSSQKGRPAAAALQVWFDVEGRRDA